MAGLRNRTRPGLEGMSAWALLLPLLAASLSCLSGAVGNPQANGALTSGDVALPSSSLIAQPLSRRPSPAAGPSRRVLATGGGAARRVLSSPMANDTDDLEVPKEEDLLAPWTSPEVPITEDEYFGAPVHSHEEAPAPPVPEDPPPGDGSKKLRPTGPDDFKRIALAAAKGPENSVIITCVNEGYIRFFKNWVAFLEKLHLTDRLLVFSDDEPTHNFIEERWPGHSVFQVPVPELRSYKGAGTSFHMFGSRDFFEFAKRRPFYVTMLLKLKIAVLYSDLDTAWLRSPFPFFEPGFDFFIQDDSRWTTPGKSFDQLTKLQKYEGEKNLCSCFLFFRPTFQSLRITKQWGHFMKTTIFSGYGADQPRLNRAINKAFKSKTLRPPAIGLLPLPMFPPGWLFFTKSGWRDKYDDKISVVHNNWIKGSSACKVKRFEEAGLWLLKDEKEFPDDPNLHCQIWGQSWSFNGTQANHVITPSQ